jgi:uncharacterized protein
VKALLDTNVLIAAFVTEGICSRLLARGRRKQFDLVACPFILQEFERVLSTKFRLTKSDLREVLEVLSEAIQSIVEPAVIAKGVCRDPDDDAILACAATAKVDYLVTGDKDLLELKTFRGIRIIPPKELECLFPD